MLTADSKSLVTALDSVRNKLTSLEGKVAAAKSRLTSLATGANPFEMLKGDLSSFIGSIPGVGPALQSMMRGAEMFYGKVRSVQKDVLDQGKHALGLGADVEKYTALRFAVSDAEALDTAIGRLNVSTFNAATSSEELAAVYKRLGLDASVLTSLDPTETFVRVAGALKGITNDYERSALAKTLFGKGFIGIMPDVMKGEAGLRKWMDVAKKRGLVVSQEDVEASKQLAASLKMIDTTTDAWWRKISIGLAPVMRSIADDMADTHREAKGLIGLLNSMTKEGVAKSTLAYKFAADELTELDQFERGWERYKKFVSSGGLTNKNNSLMREFLETWGSTTPANTKARRAWEEEEARLSKAANEARKQNEILKRTEHTLKLIDGAADGAAKSISAMVAKIAENNKFFAGQGAFNHVLQQFNDLRARLAESGATADQFALSVSGLLNQLNQLHQFESPAFLEQGSLDAFSEMAKAQRGAQADRERGGDLQQRIANAIEKLQRDQSEQLRVGKEIAKQLDKIVTVK